MQVFIFSFSELWILSPVRVTTELLPNTTVLFVEFYTEPELVP